MKTLPSSGEMAVLRQLFFNGPTWDGDIISKNSRGELFDRGWADRVEGWTFLTKAGMELAVIFAEDKERWQRRRAA